jgi:pyruvate,water dikinase
MGPGGHSRLLKGPTATRQLSLGVTPTRAPRTGTKLFVNMAFAERAEEIAKQDVDGVGLLRSEFLVSDALGGVHPRLTIERGDQQRFVASLAQSVTQVTRAFGERPVLYRSLVYRSDEFANLEGGKRFEPIEENPVLGNRGCFRYVHDPAQFCLELDALAQVFDETPNIVLMIPFVRSIWELEACLDLVRESPAGEGLPVWIVAEVPSAVFRIPQYASLGVKGVSIGLKNLTQLVLGVDRDSEICADLFEETDAAVVDLVEHIVDVASASGLDTSITGLPFGDTDLAMNLIRRGIGSLSVNPDELQRVARVLETTSPTLCRPS